MKKTIQLLVSASALLCCAAKATLVSHYTFDETAGNTAVDSGPAGVNGTIGSNVTLGAPGVFGTAFTFNNDTSDNGIMDMGNATGLFNSITASQQLTISVWLRWEPGSGTRDSVVFLGDNTVANRYIDIGTTATGGIYGRTRNNQGTGFSDGIRGTGLNNGQWHHVAYTTDAISGVAQLYINGVPQGAQAGPNTFPTTFNNFEIGRLGRSSPADAFAGSVDDLKIYDTVLSNREIAQLAGVTADPILQTQAAYSFVNNGLPEVLVVPFTNEGTDETLVFAETDAVTFGGPDGERFNVASFDNNIPPGATGEIRINFDPGDVTILTATMTVATNDSLLPAKTIALNVMVADPVAVVEQTEIDFGAFISVTQPLTKTLTVRNDGAASDLTVYEASVAGNTAFTAAETVPFTIAPGTSHDIVVTFDPAGTEGTFAGNLEIFTDAFRNGAFTIPISAEVKLSNPDASLVSHFTFDDETNLGSDTGTFNNNGTPVGKVQWSSAARIGTGALQLDGSNAALNLGTTTGTDYTTRLFDDGDGFTVACWANVAVNTSDRVRFFSSYANGAASLTQGWGVGLRNTSRALVGTTYGKVDYLSPSNIAPARGEWHHYAYVFRNSPVNRIDFYIDGVLVASQSATNVGINEATDVGFAIGALGRSNAIEAFNGLLDDLRIYDKELTAANIADLQGYPSPPDSDYASWASGFGLDPSGNGRYLEDPDGDGIVNAIEYVLGSSPASAETSNLPAAREESGNLVFVYRRKISAVTGGFAVEVEYSDNLATDSWTTAVNGQGGVSISVSSVDAETEEVIVTLPSDGPRMFARLRVTLP